MLLLVITSILYINEWVCGIFLVNIVEIPLKTSETNAVELAGNAEVKEFVTYESKSHDLISEKNWS